MTALLLALQLATCSLDSTLLRTVDGDTYLLRVTLAFDVSVTVSIRLAGLDTPELNTPEGKRAAKDADALLRAARVTIVPTGARTFARHVAHVFVAGVPIANWLRAAGHEKRR